VRQLDRRLGALVSELRESGELDRAWLVFTSDHGEEFLEHEMWGHGYLLCNHQLHVPLWFREPGARSARRRVAHVVNLADVMPTLLAALSLPVPAGVQGVDRSSWLFEPPTGQSRTVAIGSGVIGRPELSSIRTDRYHLVWDEATDEVYLFDSVTDPEEAIDVSGSEPEVSRTLHQLLRSELARFDDAQSLDSESVPIPEDLRERLRGLGYIP
jgi:arylsulfatase A-like enzyme